MNRKCDVVIVGAGAAWLRLAATLIETRVVRAQRDLAAARAVSSAQDEQ